MVGVFASRLLLSSMVWTECRSVARRSETDLSHRSQMLPHAHVALLRSGCVPAGSGARCSTRPLYRSAALPIPYSRGSLCLGESFVVLGSLPARLVLWATAPRLPKVGHLDLVPDRSLDARRIDVRLQPVLRSGRERAVLCGRPRNVSFPSSGSDSFGVGQLHDGHGTLMGDAVSHVIRTPSPLRRCFVLSTVHRITSKHGSDGTQLCSRRPHYRLLCAANGCAIRVESRVRDCARYDWSQPTEFHGPPREPI